MGILLIIYVLYWIVLTERFTLESIIIGSVVCLIVFLFNRPAISIGNSTKPIRFRTIKLWCLYALLLVKEIFKSNFHVAKIVLNPKIKIAPNLTIIKTEITSSLYRSILANSITLTPGTLTINLKDNELLVHCLENESSLSLNNSMLEKIIMKAEDIQ